MKLGYNTNGLMCHRIEDAFELLHRHGFQSIAITRDHFLFDPQSKQLAGEVEKICGLLDQYQFSCVIETGARFLLDPFRKHEPTLMSSLAEERTIRVNFLSECLELAALLNADAVSFWSGILLEDLDSNSAFDRLYDGCARVVELAESLNVKLAFEPEPGMFIEKMDEYRILADRLGSDLFGLTIDIGHLQCVEDPPIEQYLEHFSQKIWNIHIEDMCRGKHEHLRFGEGEIDFPSVLSKLVEIDYKYGVHVELSRHSHMAHIVVPESARFLQTILNSCGR